MSRPINIKFITLIFKTLIWLHFVPFITRAQSSTISPDSITIFPQSSSGIVFQIETPNSVSTRNAVARILHNGSTGLTLDLYKSNTSNSYDVLSSVNNGSGGHAGFFRVTNPSNIGTAITAVSSGQGRTMFLNQVGTGPGAKVQINNSSNNETALTVSTNGNGPAGEFISLNSQSSADALSILNAGKGYSLHANNASIDGLGSFFINSNTNNEKDVITGVTSGIGNVLKLDYNGIGTSDTKHKNIAIFQKNTVNVARIDNLGKGYFNGGTQNSGADIAEAFEAEGVVNQYEPGDVLIISTDLDRTVKKSDGAYSNLVAGVYATKPGVLLTETHIDISLDNRIPMGVIGVIPTKVCNENGPIARGDMLVTSSQKGFAMKGDLGKIAIGQVLGKALENFNSENGLIKVLVNVK